MLVLTCIITLCNKEKLTSINTCINLIVSWNLQLSYINLHKHNIQFQFCQSLWYSRLLYKLKSQTAKIHLKLYIFAWQFQLHVPHEFLHVQSFSSIQVCRYQLGLSSGKCGYFDFRHMIVCTRPDHKNLTYKCQYKVQSHLLNVFFFSF